MPKTETGTRLKTSKNNHTSNLKHVKEPEGLRMLEGFQSSLAHVVTETVNQEMIRLRSLVDDLIAHPKKNPRGLAEVSEASLVAHEQLSFLRLTLAPPFAGLKQSLEWYAQLASSLKGPRFDPIQCEFKLGPCDARLEDLDRSLQRHIYRIAQEAVSVRLGWRGVHKTVRITIELRCTRRQIRVIITYHDEPPLVDFTPILPTVPHRAKLIGAQVRWRNVHPGVEFSCVAPVKYEMREDDEDEED